MEPTVRRYRETDAPAIVHPSLRAWAPVFASLRDVMGDDIFHQVYGSDWRRHQQHDVEEVLHGEEEASRIWVVERDKEVIAFVAARLKVDEGWGEIKMLAVDPDSQNEGIGTLLTEMATEWIRDAGLPLAVIQTGGDVGHAPARHTYEKAGYTPAPTMYYFRLLRSASHADDEGARDDGAPA